MKLSEIVRELTRKKSDGTRLYTQTTLAQALNTNQSAISQMLAARVWDDHWEIFLRLLPLCRKIGIDPARDLNSKALAGGLIHAAMDKAVNGTNPSPKRGSKK